MVKFILIRHGLTQWNASGKFQGQSDVPLAPQGVEQAEKLAANFPPIKIDKIFASPLQRAFLTGKTLAAKLQLPITTDPRLMEINFGLWESLTMDEINAQWSKELADFFAHPSQVIIPGGESFSQVQARAMSFIQECLDKYEDKTFALVAHGGILRTILCTMMQIPLDNLWCLRQDNTALNIVTKYQDNPSFIVELINGTAHLQTVPQSTKSGL